MSDFDDVLQGYLECALWSTHADHLDPEGTGAAGSLDDHFGIEDVAPEALAEITEELQAFLETFAQDFDLYREVLSRPGSQGAEHFGHDLWLTRNGHGAGFWDRGLGELGTRLTANSKPLGSQDIYAGDDGKLHVQ